MQSDFLRKLSILATALAFAGALTACGDDDGDDDDDDDDMAMVDGGPQGEGEVRIVHLSPTTGAVDVFVNGAASGISNVTFPASTDFVALPAASYDFAVAPAGAGVDGAVISLDDFSLADGTSWSFVAWGSLDGDTLPAIAINQDYADLEAGDIRLEIVHAAEGIPTVDVYAIAITPETQLAEGIAPGSSATVDVTLADLPAGIPAVPVVLDAGQDGTADATFNVPTSLLAGGDVFFNVYAVLEDGAPVLYAHSRENSDVVAGPIAAN